MIKVFDDYLKYIEFNEGAIMKKHKVVRKTLLGKILSLPPKILNANKK